MHPSETAPLPLYQQLAQDIAQKIRAGEYSEGSKLPTEEMLGRKYRVSRITVRNALHELAKKELVESKQGRGTYVTGKKLERNISVPGSFNKFCIENGCTPGVRIVSSGICAPSATDVRMLRLEEGEQVVEIKRLLSMDEQPTIVDIFHFRERYAFLLAEKLENTSILGVLTDKYGFQFDHLHRSIGLVYAGKDIARLLAVKQGYPLLHIDSYVETLTSRDRCRSIQFVLGDRFRLEV